jgi:hypothetical protein
MENSEELKLFEQLDIKIYHGNNSFQSLKQKMKDEDITICVLLWNYHFQVVLQVHIFILLIQ